MEKVENNGPFIYLIRLLCFFAYTSRHLNCQNNLKDVIERLQHNLMIQNLPVMLLSEQELCRWLRVQIPSQLNIQNENEI